MKWISVEDRLPKIGQKGYSESVIVYFLSELDDTKGRATAAFCYDGWHIAGLFCDEKVKVTHWMPLPKPPEEG